MLNSGDILDGKYEVIRMLGKGGMGTEIGRASCRERVS